jgi:hypothetical protein
MGREGKVEQMGFEPWFKGINGGGITYVGWQLVQQARSSYSEGPVTFLLQSGAGDV